MEIVILDAGYKSYTFEKELFEKHGYTLKIYPSYEGEKAEKRKFAENADGILVRHTQIDEEFLTGLKNLKAIVRYGVGYDNVNVDDCTKFGVKFANVQGYGNHSVSDHALAMMMVCTRAMWDIKHQVSQNFAAPPVPDIFELHDKTLGIIGLGRIGSHLCKKAGPLFTKTIAADPYKPQDHFEKLNAEQVTLDELLQTADVISIHCNLTEETNHILNSEAFSKMGKKPIILNTSRQRYYFTKS